MDAAARTAHDSTLQPFSEMEHYKHADELPPEIMADSYDKLERLCLKYMNEDDFSKVEQAYCFAAEKHCNQKRRSGEMYINHPVEVAIILADLKMDCDVVCAALLHDTVEDTETSLADVSGLFGDTVAELVDGLVDLVSRGLRHELVVVDHIGHRFDRYAGRLRDLAHGHHVLAVGAILLRHVNPFSPKTSHTFGPNTGFRPLQR